jgi:hypothetical protein
MSLELVLAIVAFVCAVVAGILGRAGTITILLAVATALVALNQILGGGLITG